MDTIYVLTYISENYRTFMQEGEILLDYREEWYYGWLQVLAVKKVPVLCHIPGGIK